MNDPLTPGTSIPSEETSGGALLVYGAYGYTGELVAREAVERGVRPILAGRRAEALAPLAAELGCPSRAFGLDELASDGARRHLEGVSTVVHCAGPFIRTSRPMVEACLAAGVHYLDITGEIAVFERVLAIDAKARGAGVALVPGVGFDVVPTDCLAARLSRELPGATHLELAFWADGGSWSRGTLKTMIESLPHMGAVRLAGELVPVPPAYQQKSVRFTGGRRRVVTIPWGDVTTAYHTTRIPTIRVFSAMPPAAVRRMEQLAPLLPLAGAKPVKRLLQKGVEASVTGPDESTRQSARMHLWGRAFDAATGAAVEGRLTTPEGYRLTALSAVECALRTAGGDVEPGAWTPSRAFGEDLVEGLPGVTPIETEHSGGG